ncbi:MAG: ABC transporter permease subunit [Oscillospiraceae bacterium]
MFEPGLIMARWCLSASRGPHGLQFVIKLKETEFVLAAEASGCSRLAIVVKHILPNTPPSIIVYATLRIATVLRILPAFRLLAWVLSHQRRIGA